MRKLVLVAALVLIAGGAQAATINVVAGSFGHFRLLGASNVDVDGSLYDVQFLEGRCQDLYTGCNEASDFTFQTGASAKLASQALLDQVLLNFSLGREFDGFSDPVRGCRTLQVPYCQIITPFKVEFASTIDNVSSCFFGNDPSRQCYTAFAARNYDDRQGINPDLVIMDVRNTRDDSSNAAGGSFAPVSTFAVWSVTPVPEPNTALLLGLGLTGLAATGRRRSRS